MPQVNGPANNYFVTMLQRLQAQVQALASQLTLGQSVRDNNGNLRVQMGVLADGSYGVEAFDNDGNVRTQLGELPDGDYGLQVTDGLGNTGEVNPPVFGSAGGAVTTSSTTWVALSGGPSVNAWVGTSRALVLANAEVIIAAGVSGSISVSVDGATPVDTNGNYATFGISGTTGGGSSVSLAWLATGLSQGEHTFAVWYENNGSGTPEFANRSITVIAF